MPDSAISGQDATAAADAGLGADGQEAGRVNGMMSLVGKRTAERDEARAELDRLREELAAANAVAEPALEAPGPPLLEPQLPDSTDEPDEPPEGSEEDEEPQAATGQPPEYELPVGSTLVTPDGSMFLVGMSGPGTIASTSPARSIARPKTDLDRARQRFNAELPSIVAEMKERALLRGD